MEQESTTETNRHLVCAYDGPEDRTGIDEGNNSMRNTSATMENATIRPLKVRETIENRLPKTLAKTDDCLYPESTAVWHTQSRGHDAPPAALLNLKQITATRADVMMTFRQSDKIMFTAGALRGIPVQDNVAADGEKTAAAATKSKTKAKETLGNYHPVKLSWIMNSQVPGFTLSVVRRDPRHGDREGDNEPVTVRFHVNNMDVRTDD